VDWHCIRFGASKQNYTHGVYANSCVKVPFAAKTSVPRQRHNPNAFRDYKLRFGRSKTALYSRPVPWLRGRRRLPVAASEPSRAMNKECNCNQYEREVYKRHYSYFGRMVFYPFQPGHQSRSHGSDQEFPSRPQPSADALPLSGTGVPK
jgi:hypothetical protein